MSRRDKSIRVPVSILRDRYEASPVTASDLARELGWYACGSPDSSRVKRSLGLIMETSGPRYGKRVRKFRKTMDIDTAERIGDALGMAWWEIEQELEEMERAA